MRTAREWKVPPRVILRGTDPGEWSHADRVLAVALVIADQLRCSGCGQPKHESWNPDSDGWYEHREAMCNGCAALERAADGDRKHHPERKRWVVDTRPLEVELKPWQIPN